MRPHTILIFLAMLMITLGLAMISLAASVVNWMTVFGLAAIFLLASLREQTRGLNR